MKLPAILYLTETGRRAGGMRMRSGRRQNLRKRKLAGMVLFVAAFFLSAALLGKGCFLLADKCISAFAKNIGEGDSGEPVQEVSAGNPEGLFPVSDEVGPSGLIAIDPGHGGEDDGCYRDGVSEAKVNQIGRASCRERV